MSRSQIEFLRHMLDEANYLARSTEGLSKDAFIANENLNRAFPRSLEIMGEAAKQVDPAFQLKYTEVDWSGLARLRDKLIHHYFGIDYDLLWEILTEEIPGIRDALQRIVEHQAE